jgi:hypothetical protein
MFKLEFATDNAAFQDGARIDEAARILREIADKMESKAQLGGGRVRDVNGNTVGHWEMTPFQ